MGFLGLYHPTLVLRQQTHAHTQTFTFVSHSLWHLNSPPSETPILCQSFNMRHHSCTRAAGGRGVCRFFNQHQLYELLLCLRYSVRLLPPSPAFPPSVRSCFVSLRRSACKWVNPTARSHPPNPQCTPGTKTSMGSQFPDTQWSLNLRGSNPFSLCTRPPFWCFNPHPPHPSLAPALLAASHDAAAMDFRSIGAELIGARLALSFQSDSWISQVRFCSTLQHLLYWTAVLGLRIIHSKYAIQIRDCCSHL